MTGFRVHMGGAQALYNIQPDITILGKVIGGGLPVGAFGGSAELMNHLAPEGPVYHAGTLSGNPLAMAAGLATLEVLEKPHVFEYISTRFHKIEEALIDIAHQAGVPTYNTHVGSMACTFFHEGLVNNYADATASDTDRYATFFWAMLENGVYIAPSQYEVMFMSLEHSDEDINRTLEAAKDAFARVAASM